MSQFNTLRTIAGIAETTANWNQTALILVDYQKEYTSGMLALGEAGTQAIQQAQKLLNYCREQQVPVFHVVHHAAPGSKVFHPQTEMAGIVEPLCPADNETIVIKSMPNSFFNTGLENLLKSTGRKELVIAGLMSHMCVTATTIRATELGYTNIVCADACATRSLKDENGQVVDADMLHHASMAALSDRYAAILNLKQLIAAG
ncbi:Streptothricin hydrolase [Vibrio aerogenes CECT 7868]|uniref:Streptothricin hydrolase n=1 Tax=Vibrio aerogenes CECT 7868 TaxID=1216006 RepID=A0A1M6APL3_9VIBR|nr:cysteine hydrolase family protein [Vibrio aerogenes]SHI38371.1 Streptothricin hydrolase [Vibrio aerogenes CECT 7868]